ncbi:MULTISPECIES: Flp family type IVb pilin [Pasteurellaceae]|uniref:Flp family type IVb pilin n=1 Tax=Pasteurella atlantica TaxID=2827233 RepID=A0AAW8CKS8_9PAST|nr:Flp family type IVb pilin [Pasteurella atlantica]MBR0573548.1 Flp family type IVb pilin [Pasteurella atlantica]MDP8039592.1 Flp family type IVb pilin [Pasteurella atlantica]MDP8041683.1 Flp family type IVb pilin [Pasteurella atlantica]MDP8043819.1 Flp family type IVb pilin [Pasteurella atlantica]MDP8045904.1 Flp family type IVb pilin [Pasteurella atlantica]
MLNMLTIQAYVSVTEAFRQLKNNQRGVTAIEYGLIAVFIAAFIIVVFGSDDGFISKMKTKFEQLGTSITAVSVSK